MEAKDLAKLEARLMILEALTSMSVALRYIDRSRATASYDAAAEVRTDVRAWFDALAANAVSPLHEAALLDVGERMLRHIEGLVRAGRPG